MGDSLRLLEKKVDQVLELVGQLRQQNNTLTKENKSLQSELAEIRRINRKLTVSTSDRSEMVKAKLNSVLSRVEELEDLKL